MKIHVINPNTSVEMTQEIDRAARKYARETTEIKTIGLEEGPSSIGSNYEIDLISYGVLEKVIDANEQKFDAIIIACYGDPHLESAREISGVPVYGIAESSMHFAAILGYQFSILAPSQRAVPIFKEVIKRVGLESKCASIRPAGLSTLEISRDQRAILTRLIETAQTAINEDGAEVICLGCAAMAGLDKIMEEQLKIPVLDGVVCAVKIAEAAFDYGLKQSKINAFRSPQPKKWAGMNRFRIVR